MPPFPHLLHTLQSTAVQILSQLLHLNRVCKITIISWLQNLLITFLCCIQKSHRFNYLNRNLFIIFGSCVSFSLQLASSLASTLILWKQHSPFFIIHHPSSRHHYLLPRFQQKPLHQDAFTQLCPLLIHQVVLYPAGTVFSQNINRIIPSIFVMPSR